MPYIRQWTMISAAISFQGVKQTFFTVSVNHSLLPSNPTQPHTGDKPFVTTSYITLPLSSL